MSIFGATLYAPNGSAINAGLIALSLTQSLGSPAASLSARFICDNHPGEIIKADVTLDGIPIFSGKLDRLKTSFSEDGILLQAECRSDGALLLDNEALPHVYTDADTDTVFSRCIAPYGFSLVNPAGKRRLSLYTVRKGLSEWEAFCGFVERAYSLTPYMDGNRVIIGKPNPGTGFTLSNTASGYRFTKLEHVFKPYEIISEVIIRGSDGYYSSRVTNPYAARYGIRRTRYSSPTSELAETASADAYSRINASMLAREEIRVTAPEIINSYPGRAASVVAGTFSRYGMMVSSQTYRMDSSGCYTDLVLTLSEV